MRLDEYLEIVSEQIRYKKIRSTVTEELKNHILDPVEAFEACGAFPEEAMERAIREMGDPVETGVSLDRIHRPQMHWGIVFFIKTAIGLLINLQVIPYVSVSMALLSYGGSSIIISYILLGVILSVYRYKNILPAKNTDQPGNT